MVVTALSGRACMVSPTTMECPLRPPSISTPLRLQTLVDLVPPPCTNVPPASVADLVIMVDQLPELRRIQVPQLVLAALEVFRTPSPDLKATLTKARMDSSKEASRDLVKNL